MTTDVPRRLRPRAPQRNNTIRHTRGASSAQGSTSAARPVHATRTVRRYVPPTIGGVVVGDTSLAAEYEAGGRGLAIESTSNINPDSTTKATINAVAEGINAQALATQGGAFCYSSKSTGDGSAAFGPYGEAHGVGCVSLGLSAKAGTEAAPLTSAAAILGIADTDLTVVLGDDSHTVLVGGQLVVKDTLGVWRRIVVDGTTGALSTVAYP